MTFPVKIFSGRSNPELASKICQHIGTPLFEAKIKDFANGEINFEIGENVRGADVFFIQTGADPVNKNLMESLIAVDAFRRASASKITIVMPLYAYSRQDKKDKPRVPITAELVARLLIEAGIDRILTMDLHAGQIQGYFKKIPADNLYASPIIFPFIKENFDHDLVIVSPDAGGVARARAYGKMLDCDIAIMDKRRVKDNEVKEMRVIGDVSGKKAVILDDMADTCGTLVKATKKLLETGCTEVSACITHPIFSQDAIEKIAESEIKQLIVTDTLMLRDEAKACSKIVQLSSAPLFAKAIMSIHNEESLSNLFDILY